MTFGTTESMIGGKADTTRSKWSVLAIAVVLGVASAMSPIMAPSASAVALLVGNSFTANGLNITVTGCTYEVGPSSLGCAAGNFEIVADPGGPGATVRIQGAGGSDLITASLGTVRHDIGVSLSITAINPGTTVNQVSMRWLAQRPARPAQPSPSRRSEKRSRWVRM